MLLEVPSRHLAGAKHRQHIFHHSRFDRHARTFKELPVRGLKTCSFQQEREQLDARLIRSCLLGESLDKPQGCGRSMFFRESRHEVGKACLREIDYRISTREVAENVRHFVMGKLGRQLDALARTSLLSLMSTITQTRVNPVKIAA